MRIRPALAHATAILVLTGLPLVPLPSEAAPTCKGIEGNAEAAVRRVWAAAVAIELTTPSGQPAYGSGIAWDQSGHIVTNHHVAEAGVNPIVTFASGERRRGVVVADAPQYDIAVIKVGGAPTTPVDPALDAGLHSGETVLAIGNPFGRGMTVTGGSFEGSDRQIMIPPGIALSGLLQTDLPFKPGNSGGPVFDCRGQVIGMAAAVLPRESGTGAIGFVIPAAQLERVVASITNRGATIARAESAPGPGATSDAGHPSGRPGLGLMVAPLGNRGLVIDQVLPGTPAAEAGAAIGDVIARLDGRPVSMVAELTNHVRRSGVGAVVVLTVSREGRRIDLPIRIMPVNFNL